jgi:hypothetical protein
MFLLKDFGSSKFLQFLIFFSFEAVCILQSMAREKITFFYYDYSFAHMCIYCLGHFCPLSFSITSRQNLPLSLILLKNRHKHNKKDKAFLLVELRTAIQKYS